MMMARRKSEDGEPFHRITSRRPTAIEMVSATATRRAVFAMMPAGLAAVANSDIAAEDTFMWLPERASITTTNMRRGSRARQRYATNGGFPAMNRENTVRAQLIGRLSAQGPLRDIRISGLTSF